MNYWEFLHNSTDDRYRDYQLVVNDQKRLADTMAKDGITEWIS